MSRRALALFLLLTIGRVVVADEPVIPAPVSVNQAPRPLATQRPASPLVAVLRQKQTELAKLQQEIAELRAQTRTPQQILIRASVLEVSLTKMEKLGVDVGSVSSGCSTMPAEKSLEMIRTLTGNNTGKVLSQPTIVALDGQPVSFHVGGEIPIPRMQPSKEAIDFRPVGTQLDILPQSLGDNRVRLDLKLRLGEVDSSQTVKINGSTVPAFNVRQICTGIESAYGESTVLSGLVETRHEAIKTGGKMVDVENRIGLILVITPKPVELPQTAQRTVGQIAPQ